MKRTILLILGVLFSVSIVNAQGRKTESRQSIGITFSSLGINDAVLFERLDGAPGYDGDGFFNIGVVYLRSLEGWLKMETGIEYGRYRFTIRPNVYPGTDQKDRKEHFSMVSVPLLLRAEFLNYLFVNAGMILDIQPGGQTSIDRQTGLGFLAGLGFHYDFNAGPSLFVNPYLKLHSVLPFSDFRHHYRVLEAGFRLGLLYAL